MELEQQTRKKRKAWIWLLICPICILLTAAGILAVFWYTDADERLYRQGVELLNAGEYQSAIEVFESLPHHEQASVRILEAKYAIASDLMRDEAYLEAAQLFSQIESHPDSTAQAQICYYNLASSARVAKDYEGAREYYTLAGDHRDAAAQAQRMTYTLGHNAFLSGEYETANNYFEQLAGSQEDYGYYHFETLKDARDYLDRQRLQLSDRICFHIDRDSDETFYETLRNLFPCQYYYANYYEADQLLTIAGINYYSGENILYAWRNNDTSRLTEDELAAMELALQVVAQAEAETDNDFEKELWLHNWLCKQVTYESPDMDIRRKDFIQLRELSCVGAMLDGAANCQGYADAFYLLGSMAGFEVGKVLGLTGEGHIWNTIMLDGQRYIVDVTFDDMSDYDLDGWTYTFFNTYWSPYIYDPYGNDDASPDVVTEQDLSQTYFKQKNCIFSNLNDAAEHLLHQRDESGSSWSYAMIKNMIIDHDALSRAIKSSAEYTGAPFHWSQLLEYYGSSTYVTIYWE